MYIIKKCVKPHYLLITGQKSTEITLQANIRCQRSAAQHAATRSTSPRWCPRTWRPPPSASASAWATARRRPPRSRCRGRGTSSPEPRWRAPSLVGFLNFDIDTVIICDNLVENTYFLLFTFILSAYERIFDEWHLNKLSQCCQNKNFPKIPAYNTYSRF